MNDLAPSLNKNSSLEFQTDQLRQIIRIDDLAMQHYAFGMATQASDVFTALKLVQDVYIQEGYMRKEQCSGPCRILKQHYHEKTAVFVGKKQEDIAFTVSLFPDSELGLPMDSIYRQELDHLRSLGRKIGEVGCLATHPDHRNGSQNILMHGNKIMLKYAMEHLELDDLVIVVHPKHERVYKEVLMFEDIHSGTVKPYPEVNNNPAVALRLNLDEIEEILRHVYQNQAPETNLHHFLFVKDSTNIEMGLDQKIEPMLWNEGPYWSV